jgi:4-hydroxy-tetrahydrodipicolinate reductase
MTSDAPMAADKPAAVCRAGASGRMGHMLIEAVRASPDDCVLAARSTWPPARHRPGRHAFLGHASGVPVTATCAGPAGCEC